MPNGLPHAGQQQDMNHVMQLLEQLSAVHRENREQTEKIVSSVQQLQARAQETGSQPTLSQINGVLNPNPSAEVADLQNRLHQANSTIRELTHDVNTLHSINNIYQDTLAGLMDKVRQHAYDHTACILAWHRHYNDIVQGLRDDNLEVRMEHSRWQEGLGRMVDSSRQTLRTLSEEENPLLVRIADLEYDRRVMRRVLGWDQDQEVYND